MQCTQIMGKFHLVCSEGFFFSLGQQMPPKAIKRYLKLHELRLKKNGYCCLPGKDNNSVRAFLNQEFSQHRQQLGQLPTKVASKIISDFWWIRAQGLEDFFVS